MTFTKQVSDLLEGTILVQIPCLWNSSLGDVFGLSAGAGIWSTLPLVIRVDHSTTSSILKPLLSSAHHELLGSLLRLNLGRLISDLTVTGHRSVLLSHLCSKLLVFINNTAIVQGRRLLLSNL